MTILAVDDCALRLHDLVQLLHSVFPGDTVIAESDALAAGKLGFNHSIDALFAVAEMPRLGGYKLLEFIRHANPNAAVFLLIEPDSTFSCELWTEETDGLLYFPITEAQLCGALETIRRKHTASGGGAERLHTNIAKRNIPIRSNPGSVAQPMERGFINYNATNEEEPK